MIRIAQERITGLFALAAVEARRGEPARADRYVALARRVGTRYNVRLLNEYRELYCRRCSAYWTEGSSVRTRLRRGVRVRTCLKCGGTRRVRVRRIDPRARSAAESQRPRAPLSMAALVGEGPEDADESDFDSGEEE